jgi:hypothetical protein
MTQEDQVFVVNAVVTNLMRGTIASNLISWPLDTVVELNIIIKIRKYKWLHEGHHFILTAMEVHDAPMCDMDHFIKECVRFFHDQEVIYPCIFAFNF